MQRLTSHATRERLSRIGLEHARAHGFAFVEDQDQLSYDLHTHTRHQLLYAFEGSVRLEVANASYVLPPQRVAFIPAGVPHVTIVRNVRIVSVYLRAKLIPTAPSEVRVLAVTPLLREMVLYATRWPPSRDPGDRAANMFFASLGALCSEWLATPVAGRMPRGETPEVRRAISYLHERLADATLSGAARHAGTSTRTLRRRLHDELGTSFRELHAQARLLRALELLSDRRHSVTEVAYTLGYDSLSAFSRRFTRFAGELPSTYRARVRERSSPPLPARKRGS
jgi:AraC-like DNA-binding protein/mannose-6-phosphate isomerase-like protein (cupin superfamily)